MAALFLAAACSQEMERVPEINRPTNAHEAYLQGLLSAGLSTSALARDWITAAETALREPAEINAPFSESGYFDAASAAAVGYRFTARGGQRIEADVAVEAGRPVRVFMDLFRLLDDDPAAPVHVATGSGSPADAASLATVTDGADGADRTDGVRSLLFEPLRDGTYILRLQPELLRGARYTVQIRADASLSFPVAGRDAGAIQSVFGAERDAGSREHHGVDIFAPRGTPALAAMDGIVSRVDTTPVGGNVVWMNDTRRNIRLYYAHLDSQTVVRGQRVAVGDQVGTVGNTGNARTTPPHLHFGVYARGPVDPDPFLRRTRRDPVALDVDADRLGGMERVRLQDTIVLSGPDRHARVIGHLDRQTPVRVWGASGRWYRVTLPDGGGGYVLGSATEPATPLRREALAGLAALRDRPGPQGAVMAQLQAGIEVPVLGSFGNFLYIQTPAGLTGWLAFQ